jgi:hypothetical protein
MKNYKIITFLFLMAAHQALIGQHKQNVDLKAFHQISSHDLLDYAAELSSTRFEGRLSGSPGYEASARWVAEKLQEWGLKPGVADTSYFQWFPNSWTEVFHPGNVTIMPKDGNPGLPRILRFPDEFFPGSNSVSGEVKGEVVYAGYGITAPELNYDDYAEIDVRGKIVLIESGVPYTRNDSLLRNWEPYSYHRYKFSRARELGAVGLLYVGLIANPNTSYLEGFVYAHISEAIAEELMESTGRKFSDLKSRITATMQPASFALHRTVGIAALTRHYPDTRSCNVIGIIEGSDPELKKEAIIIGAHLDGIGSPGTLFPGALDNASGVADLLGAARALTISEVKPARSIIFIFFGGEECGLYGARKYVDEPQWPKEKILSMINLDMVGNGTGLFLGGGMSYPQIGRHFEEANRIYLHRDFRMSENRPLFGRPRTDGAVFAKGGYHTLSLGTSGTVKTVYYHHPLDNTDALTPEIMEDAAKLLYLGLLGVAGDPELSPVRE